MKYFFLLFADFTKAFRFIPGLKLLFQILLRGKEKINIPLYSYPIHLRPNSSDFSTFLQIFVEKGYDTHYVENADVIIDAGANIGLFTVFIKNKFPDARIICIEPDTNNFEWLKMNTSSLKKVEYEKAGLWSKSTHLKISDKYEMGKWALVVEESDMETELMACSMDDLMNKYNLTKIDILKIDIETSERVLFSSNYENWLPKVKMIIIELHDWVEKGCAQPFFNAIIECIPQFSFFTCGDNTVIINESFNNK